MVSVGLVLLAGQLPPRYLAIYLLRGGINNLAIIIYGNLYSKLISGINNIDAAIDILIKDYDMATLLCICIVLLMKLGLLQLMDH